MFSPRSSPAMGYLYPSLWTIFFFCTNNHVLSLSLSLSLFEDESFRTKGLTSTVLQLYHVTFFRRQNFNYSPQLHIVKCQFNSLSLSLSLSLQLSAFSAGRQLFDFILYIYIYIYKLLRLINKN